MQELAGQLQDLEKKVQTLLRDYQQTKARLSDLHTENQHLKSVIEYQKTQLADLKHQTEVGGIARSIESGGLDSQEFSQKIDEYVRKIEHCIAYLNKQL
jgi:predicted  nucleic acid-binding Zn-ribbon protein